MLTIKYNPSQLTYSILLNNQPYISNIKTLSKAQQLVAIFSKYHPTK